MAIKLDNNNWKEWEASFVLQLQNEELHYLLDENPMEGVERSNGGSGRNQKKDEELAMRILRLSLSESFQVIGSQGTVREAYKVLETICAPDTVDAEFEDMGKYLRTTLRKDLNMIQNWYYYKTKFALYNTKQEVNDKATLKFFLIGLPKEYRDVAKQCYRDGLTAEKALKLLQPISDLKKTEEKMNTRGKSGLKCFNCNKGGHKAVDCWAKKKNDSQQKANTAVKENQCVMALMKEGKSVLFKDMEVTIDDGKEKIVIPLRRDDTVTSTCLLAYDDLHRRFGHVDDKRLRVINPDKTPPRPEDFACEDCSKGKMTRSHGSPTMSMAAEEPLDSISVDVSGPHEPGRKGHRWYAIIVDSFSRYKWVLPLKKKSEVQRALDEWRKGIELKMGKTIKRTRSDNAPELKQIFEVWRKANGTEPTYTLTDSSSQNGIAERAIRTVNDGVRTMLSETSLGGRFWVEAAKATVYIANRTLSTQGVPHTLFFGIEPRTDHIRRWGCRVIRHLATSKHGSRGSESLLLGYDENVDGRYVLWDIDAKKVRVTELVHFYEKMKPKSPKEEKEVERPESSSTPEEPRIFNPRDSRQEELTERDQTHDEIKMPQGQVEDQGREEQSVKPFSETKAITGTDTTQLDAVNARLNLLIESLNLKILKRRLSEDVEVKDDQPPSQRIRIHEEDGTQQRAMIALSEPSMTLDDAIRHPTESEGWKGAIQKELKALTDFRTWHFVPKPEGCIPIDTRFVFTKKYDLDGKLEKYKARLVVRGFRQEYGVNFFESFAPTPSSATLRLFLATVCQYNMECHQVDACNAFAQSKIKEEVFIELPANVECPKGMVAKLDRCLYGLKQAAYQWNEDCTGYLKSLGFENIVTEPCLLYHAGRKMLVLLYVDDITIAAMDDKSIKWFKQLFSKRFVIKDLGETTQIIGIQVSRDRPQRRLWINQRQYIRRMVEEARFDEHRRSPIRTPVGDWGDVEPAHEDEKVLDSKSYQSILGKIMYPAMMTRPDIAFAVSSLAQASARPTPRHLGGVKRVLRYLRDTAEFSICFEARRGGMDIVGYSDADYANANDRKSVSGLIFVGLGGAISWSSKKQAAIATSTTEAEYIGLTPCAKEGIHLRRILNKILEIFETGTGKSQTLCLKDETLVLGDNQAAIKIAKSLGVKKATKHIDIQHHAIKQWIKEGRIKIGYIPTAKMAADGLTKPLGPQKMPEFRLMIGVRDPQVQWPDVPTSPELRESGGDVEKTSTSAPENVRVNR
ncbi:Retrovirus-related Pol polyprotein from transposon TNT 1-94 [Ceratocystis lukuohia]|uniref:Retrovirus-related Pol polyprotein from transposon TNT 1-94 n=1 Tax=Ceratocystis lukuohia TaxID=2019550 RepID=A0ABR4MBC4_9PEZI